jgi:tetratricopeptide (TPR) repeat protein
MTSDSFIQTCFILLFICLGCNDICANDALSKYKAANEHYKESEFSKAIKAYEELINDGFLSDDLFANNGNAYLKEQQIAKSILNFEKALLLNPNNQQAAENLSLAKEKIINPVTLIPDFFLLVIWRNFISSLGTNTWLILHLFFLTIALVYSAIRWTNFKADWKQQFISKPYSIIILILSIVLSLIFLISAKQRNQQLITDNYGIVIEENIPLLDGPDRRSNEVTILSEGLKAEILDEIDIWYKIQLADKDEGWIQKEKIELIKIKA